MTLAPFPSGWYAIGLDTMLAPGGLSIQQLFGRELVLFRTASGAYALTDAYCPHLGAHLGHGGTVCGETLRCPFHHFRFDTRGRCVETPYGGKIPTGAELASWPVVVANGLVHTWYGQGGEAPSFAVPELASEGWTDLKIQTWKLTAHPQETAENSVDVGHFTCVHGFLRAEVRTGPSEDGAVFRIGYAAERAEPTLGVNGRLAFDFDVSLHGLGVSLVETRLPTLGLDTRQWVLATPLDGTHIALSGALSIRRLPSERATEMIHLKAFELLIEAMTQDLPIWGHKRHLERPALAAGDGPIGRYRRWARQFYPGAAA